MTETATPTPGRPGPPSFGRAFRGYDPAEVDTFVGELAERVSLARTAVESFRERQDRLEREVEKLRARLAEAERARGDAERAAGEAEERERRREQLEASAQVHRAEGGLALERVGDEVARVLEAASEASANIRRRAQEEVEAARAEAQTQAQLLVDQARREATAERDTVTQLRARAAVDAAGLVDAARLQAQDDLAAARGKAAAMVQEAQDRADTLMAEALATRREVVARLEELRTALEDQVAAASSQYRDLQADLSRLSDYLRRSSS